MVFKKSRKTKSVKRSSRKSGSRVSKPVVKFVKKEIHKLAAPIQVCRSMTYTSATTMDFTSGAPAQLLITPGVYSVTDQNSQSAITSSGGNYYCNVLGHQFDKIKMKYLHMRMVYYVTTETPSMIRFLLIQAKMSKGTFPSLANILDNSVTISSLYNYNAIDFDRRYKVLWDQTKIHVNNGTPLYNTNNVAYGNSITQAKPVLISKRVKLGGKSVAYNLDDNGNEGDIDDGGLFLYILSDSSTLNSIYFNSILEYTDYQPQDKHA